MARLIYRRAVEADLPVIIALLADDVLGSSREIASAAVAQPYLDAFSEIEADANQLQCVVEEDGEIVGTLQVTLIPCLSRGGAKRGQIEGVRVVRNRRGEGIGEAMFAWAVDYCRSQGCSLVQLTTDKARPDAHRFYDRIGFVPSHVGYKMTL
ncbi:MAG: GNAT family N-acetyltransferase [Methylobacterium mesophilicum]|nr:GNAT family N-acetyltransferase [Methylobacterium mesophilicum]